VRFPGPSSRWMRATACPSRLSRSPAATLTSESLAGSLGQLDGTEATSVAPESVMGNLEAGSVGDGRSGLGEREDGARRLWGGLRRGLRGDSCGRNGLLLPGVFHLGHECGRGGLGALAGHGAEAGLHEGGGLATAAGAAALSFSEWRRSMDWPEPVSMERRLA